MDQAEENLKLDFEMSSREIDAMRRLGKTATLTSSTNVEGRFWNGLDTAVNVLWRSPEGVESQSYHLTAGQTAGDANDAKGST
jgi:hypothetical protein